MDSQSKIKQIEEYNENNFERTISNKAGENKVFPHRIFNSCTKDLLVPLTPEKIENLTDMYHRHRAIMDKKYGDDPKYFMFTRPNLNRKISQDDSKDTRKGLGIGRGIVINKNQMDTVSEYKYQNINENENGVDTSCQDEKNDWQDVDNIIEKIDKIEIISEKPVKTDVPNNVLPENENVINRNEEKSTIDLIVDNYENIKSAKVQDLDDVIHAIAKPSNDDNMNSNKNRLYNNDDLFDDYN